MAQAHLINGYKLYVEKNTDNECIAYFNSKDELDAFIRDEKLKEKNKHFQFKETFIPDITQPPRYSVMIRLKTGPHVDAEFYEEIDMKRFFERHRGNIIELESIVIDREKELRKQQNEFLGKIFVFSLIGFILYMALK